MWKLTRDINGNYVNGTWSALADGPNAPLYFASAVLRDGRVFVAGGEYNNGVTAELLAAEIYNPLTRRRLLSVVSGQLTSRMTTDYGQLTD